MNDMTKDELNRAYQDGRRDFSGVDLCREDLTGIWFRQANLSNADLIGADLTDADLRGADLQGAELAWANLRGADLTGADLRHADLTDADLSGAKISKGTISSLLTSGVLLGFRWTAFSMREGAPVLYYGCVCLDLMEWRTQAKALCEKHMPYCARNYEAVLGYLLDFLEGLESWASRIA